MDQLPPEPQPSIPVSQPVTIQNSEQPAANNAQKPSRIKHVLIWLFAGIIVLTVGIGIGAFIRHPH